jgi:hypothetical protein
VSNYVKSTNFAAKDALASGNPGKIVKGTEIDTEFNNIATAVATKADLASPTFTGTPSLPTGTTAVTQSASDDSTKLATTAFVQDVADAVKRALFPVGSIYTNATNSTNPSTLLGFGTWVAFGAGRVMVGFNAGDSLFDTAEETGGSKDSIAVSHSHTGTTNADGVHTHNIWGTFDTRTVNNSDGFLAGNAAITGDVQGTLTYNNFNGSGTQLVQNSGSHTHTFTTGSAGSSGTNANLQPYIVVYLWKRTA